MSDSVWTDAFRVERAGVDVLAGLGGGIATCVPLAIGIAAGEPAIGVTACFGGLNGALAVPRGPLRERLGWGTLAALLCTVAVAIATVVQDSAVGSAAAVLVIVAIATSLRTFGPDGGLTAFVIGAIFTITCGIPAAPLDVGERVLWFLAGSAAGTGLLVLAYAREHPFGERITAPPLPEVLAGGGRRLRQTFAHDGHLRAHAFRVAIVVAVTTLVYKLLDLEHGYWIPLTILAVLQPEEHASRVRAVQRAAGTLVGTAAIALLTTVTGEQWLLVAAQGVAAFGLFALFARNYFWLIVLLTPVALLTVSAVDYQGADIAMQRAGWSALGIAIGLVIGELVWKLAPHLPSSARPWRAD